MPRHLCRVEDGLPASSPSSYLTHGGADREAVFDTAWSYVRERASEDKPPSREHLNVYLSEIGIGWKDSEHSLLAALLSRAHRDVFACVEALCATEDASHAHPRLDQLAIAHRAFRTVETLMVEATEEAPPVPGQASVCAGATMAKEPPGRQARWSWTGEIESPLVAAAMLAMGREHVITVDYECGVTLHVNAQHAEPDAPSAGRCVQGPVQVAPISEREREPG